VREPLLVVRLLVTVHSDSDNPDLQEVLATANTNGLADLVASEVLTNLESVGYVRSVTVRQQHPKEGSIMTVKIMPNDKGNPPGKLADAELHFAEGVLEGMKLIGFGVWERRGGVGRTVTFHARSYAVNGERRSFALLRPLAELSAQERIRDLILQAFAEHENAAMTET
jgi:hypothetical protein